jgi:dihydroorotate dehydrogenase
MFYRIFLQPLLFALPPEKAHGLTISLFKAVCRIPGILFLLKMYFSVRDLRLKRQVMGLEFSNPVGLAAGFDKDGTVFREMAALGFGFVELGTVTPQPQAGNPLPRMFRLPADKALINRMGFNNQGAKALASRLSGIPRPKGLILGGNIGKNKTTPNEQATADYLACFNTLFPWVDYFVVNVSSPNTPDLRELQDKAPLAALLNALQDHNARFPSPKPILLKIAPDLNTAQLDDILQIVRQTRIAGIVATNTTIERSGLHTPLEHLREIGAGGLSGTPLCQKSTEIIRYLRTHGPQGMTIIGAGGIGNAKEAKEKLDAGADLIQIYTGLVYTGPGLPRSINKSLLD